MTDVRVVYSNAKYDGYCCQMGCSHPPRAYICTLPESTRADSWVLHVQTPEAANFGCWLLAIGFSISFQNTGFASLNCQKAWFSDNNPRNIWQIAGLSLLLQCQEGILEYAAECGE